MTLADELQYVEKYLRLEQARFGDRLHVEVSVAPEVLGALGCVDFLTIFHDPRVTDLLRAIRPQVYAKGGDYTIESLDAGERGALESVGAEIRILPLVPGKSTTSIIEKWAS